MSNKTVYIQVDKNCMTRLDDNHFIYSEEVDLIKNLTSTFSEGCLNFHDYPGLSTYKTCQQKEMINLCTLLFDNLVILNNEISVCGAFLRSVEAYQDAQ